MSTELSTEISPEIINSLILTGDMSKLTPAQQTQYYVAVCKDLGLNPLTQPFAIIVLQGKKTLYATKGCTQQLANIRKIDTEVLSRDIKDSVYIVSVRATMPDGRKTDEDGIVGISGLKGQDLANAMLKAITKAKRRAVLALCGLNMSDETEIDDTPRSEMQADAIGKSRVEQIIDTHIEPEVKDVKEEGKERNPELVKKESNKKTKNQPTSSDGNNNESISRESIQSSVGAVNLPEGHKTIQGTITEVSPIKNVEKDGKETPKVNITLEGNKYGIFLDSDTNKKLFEDICAVVDIQNKSKTNVLINIIYTERKKGEKVFFDIFGFSQVVAKKDVPI